MLFCFIFIFIIIVVVFIINFIIMIYCFIVHVIFWGNSYIFFLLLYIIWLFNIVLDYDPVIWLWLDKHISCYGLYV